MEASLKPEIEKQPGTSLLDHKEFQKVLTRALVLPLTATLFLAFFIAWQVHNLAELSEWVGHSGEVNRQTQLVQKLLVEMETGLRAYALTGESRFLEPYVQAKSEFPASIANLEALLADEPTLKAHATRIRTIGSEWVIRFSNLTRAQTGKERYSLDLGREMMDAMGSEIAFLSHLNSIEKNKRLERARLLNRIATGLGALSTLLVGLLLALSSRRHILRISGLYQEALRARDGLLEAQRNALRSRDEFLSIASHELKTPLTSLKLQVQLILKTLSRQENSLPPATEGMLSSTVKSVDRLARLVDDMLDISRIAAGRLSLRTEHFDLVELVREILARLEMQGTQSNSALELEAPAQLWGNWDRFRMEQVLTNLITNATKYGAGAPVRVCVRATEDEVMLEVRDSGIGIAHENHHRIFQRFERVQANHSVVGLGLGLYISRELVEMHGGKVELESEPGKGSIFRVRLPKVRVVSAMANA